MSPVLRIVSKVRKTLIRIRNVCLSIPFLCSSIANVFSGARNPFKISQEFYTDFSCDFKLRLYRKLYANYCCNSNEGQARGYGRITQKSSCPEWANTSNLNNSRTAHSFYELFQNIWDICGHFAVGFIYFYQIVFE